MNDFNVLVIKFSILLIIYENADNIYDIVFIIILKKFNLYMIASIDKIINTNVDKNVRKPRKNIPFLLYNSFLKNSPIPSFHSYYHHLIPIC